MRSIINPFINTSGYNCFGCSPNNENGLRMVFFEDENEVVAEWTPDGRFQGYGNVLHGGIQATLMDELASWYIYVKMDTAGVTSGMEIKFLKPVFTNSGPVKVCAGFRDRQKNIINISTRLEDNTGKICSEAIVSYFTYPEKIARERLHYPGKDAFFSRK